jgi:hypothetical protein
MRNTTICVLLVWAALTLGAVAQGTNGTNPTGSPEEQLSTLYASRHPQATAAQAREKASEFLAKLAATAPIAAEKLAAGQMDGEELASRFNLFIRETESANQERSGNATDPLERIKRLIPQDQNLATDETALNARAKEFMEKLAERSPTASESLRAGRMSDEELASRLKVFLAAPTGATGGGDQTAVASGNELEALVESFIQANFGPLSQRVNSLAYRGVLEEKGVKREFVVFRKRPNKVRLHFLADGAVVSVAAFDGREGWRQTPSKPHSPLPAPTLESIIKLARFDPLIIGYKERGAALERKPDADATKVVITIRETDGTETTTTLDREKLVEVSSSAPGSMGVGVEETRFSDHRQVGVLKVAHRQEQYRNGVLESVTTIAELKLEPGLLDQFFAPPQNRSLDYMDFAGALAVFRERAQQAVAAASPSSSSRP